MKPQLTLALIGIFWGGVLLPAGRAAVVLPFPDLTDSPGLASQRASASSTVAAARLAADDVFFRDGLRVVFAFNAVASPGGGLDVGLWNLSLEFWTSEDDFLRQRNAYRFDLPVASLRAEDRSPVRMETAGGQTRFVATAAHGSSYGDPNFIFHADLAGQPLEDLQRDLVPGGEFFVGVINRAHPADGAYYALLLGGDSSNRAVYRDAGGRLTHPGGHGLAIAFLPVPQPSAGLLSWGLAAWVWRRRRAKRGREEERSPAPRAFRSDIGETRGV